MNHLFTCLCTICTDQGRRPSGSKQSRAVKAQHVRADEARSVASFSTGEDATGSVEEATLLATLSAVEDCNGEDPLWRGWRGPTEPVDVSIYNNDAEEGVKFLVKSTATIMKHLEERHNAFLPPQYLHFASPPTSPTAAYPGPGSWEVGPTALRDTVLSNASILLYRSFLIGTRKELERMADGNDALQQIDSYLRKLEDFREAEWVRQQRATPDLQNLRRPLEFSEAKWFNSGQFPLLMAYIS